mmetsp:Transcript_12627/g.19860  ORF Transcript_12627/g.19860 Transcript_12627/m.19860 type:complete len:160 (+) Transcript_12627:1176-1655(+)
MGDHMAKGAYFVTMAMRLKENLLKESVWAQCRAIGNIQMARHIMEICKVGCPMELAPSNSVVDWYTLALFAMGSLLVAERSPIPRERRYLKGNSRTDAQQILELCQVGTFLLNDNFQVPTYVCALIMQSKQNMRCLVIHFAFDNVHESELCDVDGICSD